MLALTTSLQDTLRTGFERADRDGLPVLYRYLRPSDDIDALTELLHAAYAPLAAAGMRFVASYQDSETTRRRAAKGETIIAATREGIIGTVTLATVQSTHGSPFYDRADVASVGQFGVAPPHKGRGIGSSLMDLVEERARELGVAYLALDTSEHAHGLMELYGRRGYRFIEHVQWQDVNYRSVVMAKTLAAPQA